MNYTFDSDIVSDLHKDAFGFRPGESWWYGWNHASDEGKQAEWDSLLVALDRANDEFRDQEAHAVVVFEIHVTRCRDNGAKSREMALRWIMESSDCDGDWEYLCFKHGLPYSYFKKAA